jgi:transcriptional regulator with XRE-family HTH domain
MGGAVVFTIFNVGIKLWSHLQKKAYRQAYLSEHIRRGIAYQIRALRDQRGWKQGEFARQLNKPQSVVSRLEDPDYGKVTIQTLLEVANVFDVALQVRFVPFSTFVSSTRDVSSTSMRVSEFKDDLGFRSADATSISIFPRPPAGRSIATVWLDHLSIGERFPINVLPNFSRIEGSINVVH